MGCGSSKAGSEPSDSPQPQYQKSENSTTAVNSESSDQQQQSQCRHGSSQEFAQHEETESETVSGRSKSLTATDDRVFQTAVTEIADEDCEDERSMSSLSTTNTVDADDGLAYITEEMRLRCEGKYGLIANTLEQTTLCYDLQRELFSYGFSRVLNFPLDQIINHVDHFQQSYYLQATYDIIVIVEEEADLISDEHVRWSERLLDSCDTRHRAVREIEKQAAASQALLASNSRPSSHGLLTTGLSECSGGGDDASTQVLHSDASSLYFNATGDSPLQSYGGSIPETSVLPPEVSMDMGTPDSTPNIASKVTSPSHESQLLSLNSGSDPNFLAASSPTQVPQVRYPSKGSTDSTGTPINGRGGEGIEDRRPSTTRSRKGSVTKQTNKVTRGRAMSGAKFLNEYIVLEKLGKGAYGKVKKVQNKDNSKVLAMKIVNKEALKRRRKMGGGNAFQDVQREIAIWQKLDHDHCVHLYEVIDDPDAEELYMITDFMSGGPIAKLNGDGTVCGGPLPEARVREMLQDILLGLEYLHANDVVHRDIKPENLLLDSRSRVRLVDFGVSFLCDDGDDRVSQSYGTPAFMAPEACKGGTYQGRPTDIWALGVTVFALLVGRLPFYGNNTMAIYKAIQNLDVSFPDSFHNPDFQALAVRFLDKDPSTRITIDELKKDPWVTNHGAWMAPSLEEHSGTLVNVSEEDIANAVSKRGIVLLDRFGTIMKAVNQFRKRAQSARRRSSGGKGALVPPTMALTERGATPTPSPNDVSVALAKSIMHLVLVTPFGIRKPYWKNLLVRQWNCNLIQTNAPADPSFADVPCEVRGPMRATGVDLNEKLTVVNFNLMEHFSFDRREFLSAVEVALESRQRLRILTTAVNSEVPSPASRMVRVRPPSMSGDNSSAFSSTAGFESGADAEDES
eukprot:ANDGO_06219.mRNA.1 putative serine/threonine-protein kinase DDB_G0279405